MPVLRAALCLLCSVLLPFSGARAEAVVLTPEQLQQDLRFIQTELARIHPDPGHSVAKAELDAALAAMPAKLQQPLDAGQAWAALATLNPLFADAHLALIPADWRAQTRRHLDAGGSLFPFEVVLNAAGELRIRAELGGQPSALAGARIETINGLPSQQLVQAMLARAHGDSAEFRAHLLGKRFWLFYRLLYGTPPSYQLTLEKHGTTLRLQRAGSSQLPAWLQDEDSFARQYQFQLLPGRAALLTAHTFFWEDKARFYAFTEAAFRQMQAAGTQTLLIDVRENGGGDDDMWREGLLKYFAHQPWRWASGYRKKVIEGRQSPTEPLGAVIDAELGSWVQPQPDHPLRFHGQVYALVGRGTYSSAVLFSNVLQDFGFAKLVGSGSYARARQSGGLQSRTLPHSQLGLGVPRFILQRPAGARGAALVQPDILLADDPLEPKQLVDALLAKLAAEAPLPADTAQSDSKNAKSH